MDASNRPVMKDRIIFRSCLKSNCSNRLKIIESANKLKLVSKTFKPVLKSSEYKSPSVKTKRYNIISQEFFNNRAQLFVKPVNKVKIKMQNKSLTLKNCERGITKTAVSTNHQSSFDLLKLVRLSVNLFQFIKRLSSIK